ncbi:MAG: TIM barrel protein [Phycisphaerae bacterium]|nr:TIM barrel protein [Phycisphaerae bacterium]
MSTDKLSRRNLIRNASLMAAGVVAGSAIAQDTGTGVRRVVKKGRINQSVSRWCYGKLTLDQLCAAGVTMGLKGIDLLGAKDFPTLKRHGLVCTMTSGGGDLNNREKHDQTLASLRASIEANAEYGYPNVIAMSGNRNGIPDDVGIDNAVEALKKIAGFAEEKKVTVCIEYLNSKVNHKGYMFDHMAWGVEVCKRVGSPNVKILYDIYHAQIMEGDIIRTIRTHKDVIGHYHTGGNPGRNEIDDTQELYYPAIMRAIVDTGFTGYVAHEFVPKRDPLTSLAQGIEICDV